MAIRHIVLLAALCASTFATVINVTPCSGVGNAHCTVTQVRIEPCTNPKRCVIKKGTDVQLSFDFTPNFAADKLQSQAYSFGRAFSDFGSNNACLYTSCPSVAGQSQTFNYSLHLSKKLPKGIHSFDWKVWNEDKEDEVCCFSTTINLRN